MRFLIHNDLRSKGILYSRAHVKRLVAQGKFPPPVKGLSKENAWHEPAIDRYVAERLAAVTEPEDSSNK